MSLDQGDQHTTQHNIRAVALSQSYDAASLTPKDGTMKILLVLKWAVLWGTLCFMQGIAATVLGDVQYVVTRRGLTPEDMRVLDSAEEKTDASEVLIFSLCLVLSLRGNSTTILLWFGGISLSTSATMAR